MTPKEFIVKKLMTQLETGFIKQAAVNIADNFVLAGWTPKPVNKRQFLELMQELVAAAPDWKFNITGAKEAGDTVKMRIHVAGTNTGTIDIPLLGLTALPATGRRFNLPEEPAEAVVKGARVVALKIDGVPGGGLAGVFQQLGIPLPLPSEVGSGSPR